MRWSVLITILFFILTFNKSFASTPSEFNAYTFSYGSNYRFDKIYRNYVSLEKWRIYTCCVASEYNGLGLTAEFIDGLDYKIGARVFASFLKKHPVRGMYIYLAAEPFYANINKKESWEVAPELGLFFSTLSNKMGGSVNIYYGYDFSIANSRNFTQERHHVTLKIGVDLFYHRWSNKKNDRS
jgi:hypothetical protein